VTTTNKHAAPAPPDTLQDRFRDAIAPRTLLLGTGVLVTLSAATVTIALQMHPIVVLAVWVIGGAALTLAASATMKRARQ
jgi:hypothetical protein